MRALSRATSPATGHHLTDTMDVRSAFGRGTISCGSPCMWRPNRRGARSRYRPASTPTSRRATCWTESGRPKLDPPVTGASDDVRVAACGHAIVDDRDGADGVERTDEDVRVREQRGV